MKSFILMTTLLVSSLAFALERPPVQSGIPQEGRKHERERNHERRREHRPERRHDDRGHNRGHERSHERHRGHEDHRR